MKVNVQNDNRRLLEWASHDDDNIDTFLDMHTTFNQIHDNNDPNNFIKCQYGGGNHDSNYKSPDTDSKGRSHLSGYASIKTNPEHSINVRRIANRVLCNNGHSHCDTGH